MDALRLAGSRAWSIVGIALAGAAIAFLLFVLRPLVLAVLAACCISLALSPAVDLLARRGFRRSLSAGLGTLLLIVVGAGVIMLVVTGLASQWPEITMELNAAVDQLHRSLASAGLNGFMAESARMSLSDYSSTLISGLLPALGNLAGTVASIFVGVFVLLFTTFFFLKDGPSIARGAGSWLSLPDGIGRDWLAQAGRIIRGYVVGLTLLGAFNATIVGIGAFALGVPLIGTLVVVTLLGNYVPYVGAWVAGAYAVLIALASGGVQTALIMAVVVFLANGTLQTMLQPFAYGAALRMHPLTILLATVAGGLLAGIIGVMIAAPVTAIVQYTVQLLRKPPAGEDGHTAPDDVAPA